MSNIDLSPEMFEVLKQQCSNEIEFDIVGSYDSLKRLSNMICIAMNRTSNFTCIQLRGKSTIKPEQIYIMKTTSYCTANVDRYDYFLVIVHGEIVIVLGLIGNLIYIIEPIRRENLVGMMWILSIDEFKTKLYNDKISFISENYVIKDSYFLVA